MADEPIGDSAAYRSPDSVEERIRMRELRIRSARAQRDLVMGMQMDDVREAWGEPRDVETAGDPRFGNQRWIYPQGLGRAWGLGAARVVYFEDGVVVGWETR